MKHYYVKFVKEEGKIGLGDRFYNSLFECIGTCKEGSMIEDTDYKVLPYLFDSLESETPLCRLSSNAIWLVDKSVIKEEDLEYTLQHRSFRDEDRYVPTYEDALTFLKSMGDRAERFTIIGKVSCPCCTTFK